MAVETNDRAATRRKLTGFMSPASLTPQPTNKPLSDTPAPVATLDSIRAALKVPPASDEMPGEVWEHPVFGALRIGPMNFVGYEELARISPTGPFAEKQKAIVYFHRGILSPSLDPDDARAMLERPGCGPANIELVSALKRWSPPIDARVSELQMCIGGNAVLLMAFRVLREFGLLPELSRLLDAKEPLTPEQEAAKLSVEAVLTRMYYFEAIFNIEEIATKQGIPLTQAGADVALAASQPLEEAA